MAKNPTFHPLYFNKKVNKMNSKTSNLTITIPSLFIKQLYFLSPPFFPFHLSLLFSSCSPPIFFLSSLNAISLRQRGELAGSNSNQSRPNENGFEFLQFCEEIERLMTVSSENVNPFTAFLELPTTQAMELLHLQPIDEAPTPLSDDPLHRIDDNRKPFLTSVNGNLTFPSNKALIEHAAKLSVFDAGKHSPETSSVPSNSSASHRPRWFRRPGN
jgi:hypothetical protein